MHDRMLLEIVNINRSFRSTDERLQLLLVKHPQPYSPRGNDQNHRDARQGESCTDIWGR
jgi:hypothetical protein